MVNDSETRVEKGMSLSRGPALALGTVLLAAGLYFLYRQHFFPHFSNFPNGSAPVTGKVLFGIFGANGWTGMLTAVGGGLLLFGAAQHLLAKTMSLIVGIALGAAAIIALISGNVLGMAAANGWTEIGWGAAAAILLFNTLLPRRRGTVAAGGAAGDRPVTEREAGHTRRHELEAAGAGAAAGAYAEHRHDRGREGERNVGSDRAEHEEATAGHERAPEDATVAHDRAGGEEPTAANDQARSTAGAPAPDVRSPAGAPGAGDNPERDDPGRDSAVRAGSED